MQRERWQVLDRKTFALMKAHVAMCNQQTVRPAITRDKYAK